MCFMIGEIAARAKERSTAEKGERRKNADKNEALAARQEEILVNSQLAAKGKIPERPSLREVLRELKAKTGERSAKT